MSDLFHPDSFQGTNVLRKGKSGRAYFEGWYLKHVSKDRKHRLALIPGVFIGPEKASSHAFIQILDGMNARYEYIRFPLEQFNAARKIFKASVSHNQFGLHGLSLDLKGKDFQIQGELNYIDPVRFPVTLSSPGIMGPFAYTPFMECYHGLVSLDHKLEGALSINGKNVDLTGGRGYIEKDWGRNFPSAYVWMQSNHFETEGSLFASAAKIPYITGSFTGFIMALFFHGKLIRFATYTGAKLREVKVSPKQVWMTVEDKKYRLEIESHRSHGAVLMAPYEKAMIERVSETMTARISFQLRDRKTNKLLLEGHSDIGALEVQGDLPQIATIVD
ncbi:MAG: hypothetical protein CMN76_00470 [Spirochaetaceae bacterium]|nr:hypothetical protein [Spirochaetaceae bacterium]